MGTNRTEPSRAAFLQAFGGKGYVRVADLARRARSGSGSYKKGWEVRLVVSDEKELTRLRGRLTAAGFRPARPFQKHSRLVQPVYGLEAVRTFRSVQKEIAASSKAKASPRKRAKASPRKSSRARRAR